MIVPFVGQAYEMEAKSFDIQSSVNLYPIVSESGTSKSVTALRSVAGLSQFATAGGGGIRGGIESAGRAFFVSGESFYEIDSAGVATLRGTLDTQTSICQLEENPAQVMIIDGLYGYIFNKSTNTFTKITDSDFPTPSSLTFQDGYFIVSAANTSKFYISNLNDGLTWDTLDFTTVEGSPDNLVAVKSDRSNLWAFGTKSVELYQNTGNLSFPFQKIVGAYIETGCAAASTVKSINNMFIWLGSDENGDNIIWRSEGYNAVRVSTQAIERLIATGRSFEESYAWVYHERGHAFYCLQVKGLNTTIVLDLSTMAFHERMYRNPVSNTEEQHRGSCHIFAFNKHLVGDRENNKIYEMSLDYYDDDGDPMIRRRVSPYMAREKDLISFNQFELDMEVGIGLQSGQGSDPQVMMKYSPNGRNWSSERWVSFGKVGKYDTRVKWNKLGSARNMVFWVEVSDPVFVQINNCYVNGK